MKIGKIQTETLSKSIIALQASDLCTCIRPSIGTENLIPEEVNYTKIAIRATVMNKPGRFIARFTHEDLTIAFAPRL